MIPPKMTVTRAICEVIVVSFATIFLLYPLLHELGHALAAWIFGGTVVRITIYPAFYTECYIRPEQLGCYIMTAISGILFPLLCSLAVRSHSKQGFLVVFCLRIMSVGYSAGELVCVSKCILGSTAETSDLSVLIYKTQVDPYVSLVLAGFLLILALLLLVSIDPVRFFAKIVERHSDSRLHQNRIDIESNN